VSNIGNKDAPSTYVDFYLSDSGAFDEEDTLLRRSPTGTIKASKSKGIKFSYNFPLGQSASGKYIIAVIDADDTVSELDEENNIAVFGPIQ
jgi:subtilase family serine protease